VLHQSKLMEYPRGRHSDGKNLYVRITRPGCGSFYYRSNKYEEGLGSIDLVTLTEAREKAAAIRKLEHDGKDPKAERENARLDQEIAKGLAKTFRQVAQEFFETKLAGKQLSTIKQYRQWLRVHILPKIGDMPTGKITSNVILGDTGMGLEKKWLKMNPTAERVRWLVESILNFAEYRGYPVHLYKGKSAAGWTGHLENILPPSGDVHAVKHFASLRHQNAPCFMAMLRGYKCKSPNPNSSTAMPLLMELFLLTGVRENEGLKATWGEWETTRGIWTVPTGRNGHVKRKDERETPREIPITSHLLDLLKRAEKRCIEMGIDPSNPDALVFPGMRGAP
jgi:integrase